MNRRKIRMKEDSKMIRKKNSKVVIGCSIATAVCFGIVSYGHFYCGGLELGWVFAILTIAQMVLH